MQVKRVIGRLAATAGLVVFLGALGACSSDSPTDIDTTAATKCVMINGVIVCNE